MSRHGVRPLDARDLGAFVELAELDPVVNVFALYRARTTNLEPRWLGGEMWGRFEGGRLRAACHVGANLVTIGAAREDAAAFADRAMSRGRTVSTIVGPHEAVEVFWEGVAQSWGEPRETRWNQPHLEISGAPAIPSDPLVRRTTLADLDELYPACVAMYTEEVGLSPEAGGGADLYRARVTQLANRGWSFARFDEGRLVFKAEVACATKHAAQVQGVWVAPDRRGEGLATAGMAAVVELVQAEIAPVVSLYVNHWNNAARRVYGRVGFEETARFATVMF
ncbi:GNAT family N-acetyltransferase [Nocardioides sp.]|uniref:GNAT family N-acetyltransferase n=1 Tax=Nocardioides sp. TaxID=35761 RepID=UPI0035615796